MQRMVCMKNWVSIEGGMVCMKNWVSIEGGKVTWNVLCVGMSVRM